MDTQELTPQKDADPKEPAPKVVWLAVEPRHYAEAQARKKDSKEAYISYVLSLVFHLDGEPLQLPLTRKMGDQIAAAFEAKFGPKEGDEK